MVRPIYASRRCVCALVKGAGPSGVETKSKNTTGPAKFGGSFLPYCLLTRPGRAHSWGGQSDGERYPDIATLPAFGVRLEAKHP